MSPWIELHIDLLNHPKLVRLMHVARVIKPTALGYVTGLWIFTAEYAPNGYLTQYTSEEIGAGAGWQADANILIQILQETGWIDKKSRGLYVHNWHKYGLRYLKKNKERQQKHRRQTKGKAQLGSLPSRDNNVTVTRTNQPDQPYLSHQPHQPEQPEMFDQDSSDEEDEELAKEIRNRVRVDLSRNDLKKVLLLKREHAVNFPAALDKLHTGVKNVPQFLRAVLSKEDRTRPKSERRARSAVLIECRTCGKTHDSEAKCNVDDIAEHGA